MPWVSTFSGIATACLTDNGGHVPASGTTELPTGFILPPARQPRSGRPLRTPLLSSASHTSSLGVLAVRSRSIPMFAQLRRLITIPVRQVWCKQVLILSSGLSAAAAILYAGRLNGEAVSVGRDRA